MALAIAMLCACSASVQNSTAGEQAPPTKTEFYSPTFDLPSGWVDLDLGSTESIAHSTLWHVDNGQKNGHGIKDGGALGYCFPYDALGNLNTNLPASASDADKRRDAKMKRGIKVLDARIMAVQALTVIGESIGEEDLLAREIDGQAFWYYEGSNGKGAYCVYGVPFENHIVTLLVTGTEASLPADQQTISSSIGFAEEPEAELSGIANAMSGKSQQDAIVI